MKLIFDETGKRYFETGDERVVIYRLAAGRYRSGTAWNGVTALSESPDGAEPTALYADDIKYLQLMSAENWKGTIEAYTYPDAFNECLGQVELAQGVYISQQTRRHFGLCYTTLAGNDVEGSDFGYKIHLIYDVLAAPSDRNFQTQSDSPEPTTMSWELSAGTTEGGEGHRPTSEIVLDSRQMAEAGLADALRALEDILFGTDCIQDSDGEPILDSKGTTIQADVGHMTLPDVAGIFRAIDEAMTVRSSNGDAILDSGGQKIKATTYE